MTVPEFLSLAGTIAVPDSKRNVPWNEIIHIARLDRGRRVGERSIADSSALAAGSDLLLLAEQDAEDGPVHSK